ncbi:calcyphosin-like protein [Eupeodes corollae]|uniref:calcyphosin-like protein n=1 Tax=Eupeodes corollae TaxID=290404 RepID=UPI00248F5586|nr:calcyphosin-like protein [Eupeodes corollae]XP_055902832.1 calcyphosin-like protein [Eupeodes corollae]XP_055902833.1 calcyphosin-like protein [Eupeodes corollae]
MSYSHNSHLPDLYTKEASLSQESQRSLDNGIVKDPIDKLRLLCFSRGQTGILQLARSFRNMDDDGSKALNFDEFKTGIRDTGLNCSDDEIYEMFNSFDQDDNGSISMTEFLLKLRPPMNDRRINIINKAFDKMDNTGDGVITVADLRKVYSVKEHPKYESGEMSSDEILKEFLKNFEGKGGVSDDMVTKEEFMDYYASISATIDNDTYFDLLLRTAYKL